MTFMPRAYNQVEGAWTLLQTETCHAQPYHGGFGASLVRSLESKAHAHIVSLLHMTAKRAVSSCSSWSICQKCVVSSTFGVCSKKICEKRRNGCVLRSKQVATGVLRPTKDETGATLRRARSLLLALTRKSEVIRCDTE